MGKRFQGRALDSGMAAGHLCLIRVRQVEYLGPSIGIEPHDFGDVWYPGRVIETGTITSKGRPSIRARFATRIIRDHVNPRMARFHNRESPFPYEVKPLYRMLGRKNQGLLTVGDPCLIVIGDFHSLDRLCRNPSLSPGAIRAMFSPRLQGTWKGRILQGGMSDVVAAVLTDERLRSYPDTAKWIGHEPGMTYSVHPVEETDRDSTKSKADPPPPPQPSGRSKRKRPTYLDQVLKDLKNLQTDIFGNDLPEA